MKIVLFGATGGVGKLALEEALKAGYDVTVLARTPSKVTAKNVTVIEGDAFDEQIVAKAIEGQDAVVSCLGTTKGPGKNTSLARMAKNIAAGMEKAGVKRLVYCASAGVYGEIPGMIGKMIMFMLRNPLRDHRNALHYLLKDDVTYTIVRPMGLKNTPFDANYEEVVDGVPKSGRGVSRASVAHLMIKALADERYDNQSVSIGGSK